MISQGKINHIMDASIPGGVEGEDEGGDGG